jgi:hypothetical protein
MSDLSLAHIGLSDPKSRGFILGRIRELSALNAKPNPSSTHVYDWDSEDVSRWLVQINLADLQAAFQYKNIDGSALVLLGTHGHQDELHVLLSGHEELQISFLDSLQALRTKFDIQIKAHRETIQIESGVETPLNVCVLTSFFVYLMFSSVFHRSIV